MTSAKWNKNIEKRLIFYAPNNILASCELVMGVFYEDFSSYGFFDSLVGRVHVTSNAIKCIIE